MADKDASKPATLGIMHSDDVDCRHGVLAQTGKAKLQRLMRSNSASHIVCQQAALRWLCSPYTGAAQSMLQPLLLHVQMAGGKLPGGGGGEIIPCC